MLSRNWLFPKDLLNDEQKVEKLTGRILRANYRYKATVWLVENYIIKPILYGVGGNLHCPPKKVFLNKKKLEQAEGLQFYSVNQI